jgi:diguanylate cyclase (GGDEF)-like protein
MSLFRQLLLSVSAVFLLTLAGMQVVYVVNARSYLQQQLESHAQDAATALSLSLATVMPAGDKALMETIVSPVFDRGFYQSIKVISAKGEVLVAKELPRRPPEVPAWFARLVVLEAPSNEALVSAGWRQMGRVIVASHPNFAYQQLWRTSWETLGVLVVLYALALWVVRVFLRAILNPLTQIRQVAQAISERNFATLAAEPAAPELREVVGAINSMSGKIRQAIEGEVARAEEFRREAFQDPVSGLDNRRGFDQQVGELLLPASEAYSGALFLIELGSFKAFNQKHGFSRGDELIAHAGRALAEVWSGRHVIRARLGGATFALLLENVDIDEARQLAADACSHLELALAEQGYIPEVGFNCGGCHFEGEKPSLSALLAGSDMGLVKAQNRQANTCEVIRVESDARNEMGSQYWKQAISGALQDNRIALFAQPVLPLDGDAPLQQEVMGRLIDGQGDLIAAEQFLPMAVRHGLVGMLDRKVIDRLLHYLAGNAAATQFALNVSSHSIRDAAFVAWLRDALKQQPEIASRLVFEMAETGIVQDVEAARNFALALRAAGAQFAVDNFGLHREAFRYLQLLMPNYIKLGRGFFDNLEQNRESQFFIASVVKIAQPLEIKVIAQAIEDAGVAPLLRGLGLYGYQGFATGMPLRIV